MACGRERQRTWRVPFTSHPTPGIGPRAPPPCRPSFPRSPRLLQHGSRLIHSLVRGDPSVLSLRNAEGRSRRGGS